MEDKIEHQGVIDSIEGSHVRVKIVQKAACTGCKVKSMCSSAEQAEKWIDVYDVLAGKYHVGEEVFVCGALSMGKMAVRLAFGVPVAIIIVWMLLAIKVFGMGDVASVGSLLVILSTYFYILYANRNKLDRKFAFWIERKIIKK